MTDLETFERAVYGRAPNRVALLAGILWKLATGEIADNVAAGAPVADPRLLRLASAIAALMADPTVTIGPELFDSLSFLAPDLRRLFQGTGFSGPDFILRALSPEGLSAELLAARLPLLSLDSELAWPPEFLTELPAGTAQQALAHLIASKPIMSLRGQERRNALLDCAAVERLTRHDLIESSAERLRLTPAGMPLLDAVLREITLAD